jgi:hypothetical protein
MPSNGDSACPELLARIRQLEDEERLLAERKLVHSRSCATFAT